MSTNKDTGPVETHRPDRVPQEEGSSSAQDERSDSDTGELPLDVIFEIIKNERRRRVLEYLDETDEETVALGDLAEHIAALENGTTERALSAQQRKRVYVGLYQCHLPKMMESGIVEFDKNRGTIAVGPNVDQLGPYLDVDTDTDGGSLRAIALGFVAIAGYALAAFGGFHGIVAGALVVLTTLLVVGVSSIRTGFATSD